MQLRHASDESTSHARLQIDLEATLYVKQRLGTAKSWNGRLRQVLGVGLPRKRERVLHLANQWLGSLPHHLPAILFLASLWHRA